MRLISASFALLALVSALAVGCADETKAPASDDASNSDDATSAAGLLKDGTAQTVGVLALVNAKTTTEALLDTTVGLDKRAAATIAAKRAGADGKLGTKDDVTFKLASDVTSVSYLGASGVNKLVAYATANGFVPTGSQTLGTYDGVAFSVDDAAATLNVANAAAINVLKAAGVTTQAANSILAARPIATVLDLSKVANVGQATLQHLKAYATTPTQASTPPAAQVAADLAADVPGLDFMSESDYPLDVVNVAGQGSSPITADNIKDRIASIYVQRDGDVSLADREVEVTTVDDTLDRFTTSFDPNDPASVAAAPQWQKLANDLKAEIVDVQVFRLGHRYRDGSYVSNYLDGSIDVYIVGRSSDGALVGVHTVSVET